MSDKQQEINIRVDSIRRSLLSYQLQIEYALKAIDEGKYHRIGEVCIPDGPLQRRIGELNELLRDYD